MAAIESVSGTAFVAAEFRAEENAEMAPCTWIRLSDCSSATGPGGRRRAWPPAFRRSRTWSRFEPGIDDRLQQQLHGHFRQVVILGAGLDTRAVRKHAPGVTYFEIDDAGTLEAKQACYERQGFDVNLTFPATT